MRRLVAVVIEAHRIDPRLHRVLAEQTPRSGRLENAEAFNRVTYALFRACLEGHSDELRIVDLEPDAFVCVTSIEARPIQLFCTALKGSRAKRLEGSSTRPHVS